MHCVSSIFLSDQNWRAERLHGRAHPQPVVAGEHAHNNEFEQQMRSSSSPVNAIALVFLAVRAVHLLVATDLLTSSIGKGRGRHRLPWKFVVLEPASMQTNERKFQQERVPLLDEFMHAAAPAQPERRRNSGALHALAQIVRDVLPDVLSMTLCVVGNIGGPSDAKW